MQIKYTKLFYSTTSHVELKTDTEMMIKCPSYQFAPLQEVTKNIQNIN